MASADWRISWNEAELGSIKHAEYVRAALAGFGGAIGSEARATAPRSARHHGPSPGHMADSIHAETVLDGPEWTVRVGWDQLHAYGRFPERAQHFLVHAADRYARP